MSRIRNDFVRISGNTPRPGLTAGSLAAWFEGPPLTFITQGQSCLKICPQKKIVWGRNNFLLLWVFPNSIKYSIVYLADLFGINFLRVPVLVNNIINWTVGSFLSMLWSDCLTWQLFVVKVERLFLRTRYVHPLAETKNKRTIRNTGKIDSWQKLGQNLDRPDRMTDRMTDRITDRKKMFWLGLKSYKYQRQTCGTRMWD